MNGAKANQDALYALAFQYFQKQSNDNKLKGNIAFALFVEALTKSLEGENPSPSSFKKAFGQALSPQFSGQFLTQADDVLFKVANDLMAVEQPKIIAKALEEAHRGFRWSGVWEAMVGAILGSILLIAISILAAWFRPELLEYAKRAYHLFANPPS